MNQPNPLDQVLSTGGGKSAFTKETPPGTSVTGAILSASVQQTRDPVTKTPEVWGDGNPKQQVVISLQTTLNEDPDDDGIRALYIKAWGSQKIALAEAVAAAGGRVASDVLVPGAQLTATFTGTKPSKFGSDEKLYAYVITPAGAANLNQVATPAATVPSAAPAPVAPAPTETPAAKAKQLAALGVDPDIIATQLGVDPSIVPTLLAS